MAAGTIEQEPDAGTPDPSPPQMPPIQGAPAPLAASPSQPVTPGAGTPGLAAQPQGGIAQGTGNTKGEIPTPDVVPKYDAKKLAKAQTTLDLLNAMKPASRTDYMDWWQKQHGAIDEKYDNMKTQIGARPSDDEPQTQKEKFAALLEFGLHLMKNSAPASTNQGAVLAGTISDSTDAANQAHQANIQGKQKGYDAEANAIESARDEEQKGIGTPAAAQKEQADQNRKASENLKDTASAFKSTTDATTAKASAMGTPTYIQRPDGSILLASRDEDGKPVTQPLTGIDGKPVIGKVLGRNAGSGIDKGGEDPAAVRTYKYATQVMGIDKNAAAPILGIKPSGKPHADHASVYKSVMTATMGDDEKAKRIADQYVLDNYGAGAIPRENASPVPTPGVPPTQALADLKQGMVRDFGANGKWTVGIDGKPVRVGGGPLTPQ
jgi:hypothetical protein